MPNEWLRVLCCGSLLRVSYQLRSISLETTFRGHNFSEPYGGSGCERFDLRA